MRYMFLIWEGSDPNAEVSTEDRNSEMEGYAAFTKEVIERGLMREGDPLQPPVTATTVRVQDGETLTTDGPFAETKEWLAGYYILDCKDLDEASEMAAKIPAAKHGAIEIRPLMELPAEYSVQQ
jgi:hypothetical protein